MKVNDGYWLIRKGMTALYPVVVHHTSATQGTLTVTTLTRKNENRGAELSTPTITVELSSPAPDVIGVKITHLAGARPRTPSFEIAADPQTAVEIAEDAEDGEQATLTSGALTARIALGDPWSLTFEADGRELTGSAGKCMGAVLTDEGEHLMIERLALGVGQNVYGFGERFTPFVKNGQVVETWNEDGGTASEQAYKSVPFYLTDAGYGVFVASPDKVSFEVASEVVSRVGFSVPGQELEYYVIHGPSPKEILRRYTALTGRPALPPQWSFGLWLSTSFTTDYDEASVTGFVQEMADRDVPLSVLHFDCYWMRALQWCDFEWDPVAFPDPPAMLARLKERGLHVSVWINPYLGQTSPLFAEAAEAGYLVRRADGDVWQWDQWVAGMGLVDFTNPAARQWYAAKVTALVDLGVDCVKTDFGERIPTDVVWHDGSDPQRMHNYYSLLYNRTVFEALEASRGRGDAVVFARSATAGGQEFPVHWGGDCESTWSAMAESLRGGLSLGASGFGFWSHDIGGFEGTPSAALFKRWVAFGLLSSHSRLHGSASYRVPWAFDHEAVDVLRTFTRLKLRLMPYLWAAAVEAHEQGVPMMRAMVVEFPDDPGTAALDRQYMLGPDLLVAPVMNDDGRVTYYVPDGVWTNVLAGTMVRGPRWVTADHGFESLPLLARPGAVVAVGAREDRPDYDLADGVTLEVYPMSDGQVTEVTVHGPDGTPAAVFEVRREATVVRARLVDGTAGRWSLCLVDGPWGSDDGRGPRAVVADGAAEVAVEEFGLIVILKNM